MRLLVIGAGMMGSAAAFDMARSPGVESVTLADSNEKLAKAESSRINKMLGRKCVRAVKLDASNYGKAGKLMKGHAGVLSAVPYFFNVGLAKAAI
ncbi:MAG TPA: saccharopine dehydrogenase NADP-binding domain-containing protein, partial [Terriglobales bacterium]|nr:saccharopine dehydrogenase NADP-binding domain-containing protein [Terriglobales bacterium]